MTKSSAAKIQKKEKGSDLLFWHRQFYLSFRQRMGYSKIANLAYSEIVTIIRSFEKLKKDVIGSEG